MKKLLTTMMILGMLTSLLTAGTWASEEPEKPETADTQAEAAVLEAAPDDGTYTVEVTMEGGSGKASIQSPAKILVKDGQMSAVIVWSSDKYDYMIVDGVQYDPVTTEGGSTFEIPVAGLEEPLPVIGDTTAMSQPHEIEYTFTFDPASLTPLAAVLEDGVYTAEFTTDSSMFHVNEANEGKGVLTVKDGEMTIHVSLVSKKIVNLYPGLAADAEKEGAELLEPTVDTVTYSDGYTEEVYGFDVPVPALDEEFNLANLGTKGEWYDHKVSVSNPEPME